MTTHLNETDARTITVLFGCNLTLAAVLAVILPVASVLTFRRSHHCSFSNHSSYAANRRRLTRRRGPRILTAVRR